MKPPRLSLEGVSAGYGKRRVLDGVFLTVFPGETVALIGPNGCGKSTLLKSVVGDVAHKSGSIRLDGEEILGKSPDRIVRQGVGYVRQTRNAFPSLSVRENLEIARLASGDPPGRAEIPQGLDCLRGKIDDRAGLLSGGQRQALAVSMALQRRLSLLLLDEPIAGLSERTAGEILETVKEEQRQAGFAALLVEHRLRLIHPYVDRVVVIVEGRVVHDATDPGILLDRERLGRFYPS